MNQPTLFGDDQTAEARKLAHRRDPETSRQAAKETLASGLVSGQKNIVVDLVRKWPGRTSAELAEISGLGRYMIARRLPDLERAGLVKKGPARKCTAGWRNAVVWFPVIP